ncbi:FAD-dependent monooxygenase [Asanoa iriomotensis]|uniref:FAD-dependent oxidoreductase n=1 Tax=Asanoa iriomotensis TaxID=234613 RepID=A0ABQ4C0V5_9ACTN|nr:FAD-dependent monooxygenase [Asanoa iriomotensis]GIF56402.1 FAD-dependent oxidoreductase [Asanoa iriomotensis]
MDVERTEVLIVGGALVGLSAALFLAEQEVSAIVVERQPSALLHPRARVINPRAVEVLRQSGLVGRMHAVRSLTADMSEKSMLQADTLAGPARMLTPLADEVPEITGDLTPCEFFSIDQDRLEEIVREQAVKLGADLRYSHELTSFEQTDDGVVAVVTDDATGVRREIHARYLIAADGHGSGVRQALGIPRTGAGTLVWVLSLIFKADLTGPLRGRDVGLAYLNKPEHGTLLTPLDGNRWVFFTPYHPEAGETLDGFDDERCVQRIRAAIGVPDLSVELEVQIPKTGAKVLGFELAAQVADRFQDGRVFLVGDSAHAIPPTGAFGASTGIQDAHNLAWKISAVLKGAADPAVLDSYEDERRPVAKSTMDQALAELALRMGMGAPDGDAPGYAATVFGHRYRSAAVVDEGGPGDRPDLADIGAPGTRAPHVELSRDGAALSTIDLFGRRFVLLTADGNGVWRKAWQDAAAALDIEVDVHHIGTGGDFDDPGNRFLAAYGLTPTGVALVRPDGIVAWRAPTDDEPARLADALHRVLGRAGRG